MKFTLEWLLSHLETTLTVNEISDKLTSLGIEVEDIIDNSKKFENFVLGYVVKREKHPDADKLSLCEVDIGTDKLLQIVCGAHNVAADMKVAVALVGAIIPATGLPLKKGKIRGLESQGMMCSARELEIDLDDDGGIVDLSGNTFPIGSSLADALNLQDIIFDVSITPNRSDCFSVRGIARYLAASGAGILKPLPIENVPESIDKTIDVNIKTNNCSYFSCRAVKNVNSSAQTPSFIQRRLSAIGQKLIFAPVDIANYICLDIGQPMHIFDLDKIDSLIIRDSGENEILDTLDGNQTTIPENSIVVSSYTEALSIAGIMGGVKTSFNSNTKNILIESAYFDKISIALAGQKLRISSDSRIRNERGIDPEGVTLALNYASYLLSQIYQCSFGPVVQNGTLPFNRKEITVTFSKFKNLTGLNDKEWNTSIDSLKNLDIAVISENTSEIKVLTPSFRHDLNIEEDIIEEMVIIIGYDKIQPLELPKVDPIIYSYNDERISDLLVHNGYFEVKTFSFLDKSTALLFDKEENLIELEEPLTNEFAIMRPSAVCSLLKCFKINQNKSQPDCLFFEIGKKFSQNEGKIVESSMLTILIAGKNHKRSWSEATMDVSIYDAKGIIEKILSTVDINNYKISISDIPEYYHPGRSGIYTIRKNEKAAIFGEIHPRILKKLDISGRVIAVEISLDAIHKVHTPKTKSPLSPSPFQPVTRDFSFVVNNDVTADQILSSIHKNHLSSLHDVNIFDIYELDDDQKAVGIEAVFYPEKENFTDDQISNLSSQIVSSIQSNCNGKLRE